MNKLTCFGLLLCAKYHLVEWPKFWEVDVVICPHFADEEIEAQRSKVLKLHTE